MMLDLQASQRSQVNASLCAWFVFGFVLCALFLHAYRITSYQPMAHEQMLRFASTEQRQYVPAPPRAQARTQTGGAQARAQASVASAPRAIPDISSCPFTQSKGSGKLYIGTGCCGYIVPSSLDRSLDTVLYSFGVGEDISFELSMQCLIPDMKIYLHDPTPKAIMHFHLVTLVSRFGVLSAMSELPRYKSASCVKESYWQKIPRRDPAMTLRTVALGGKQGTADFFLPSNPDYVFGGIVTKEEGAENVGTNKLKVYTLPLNELIAEEDRTKQIILKVDIEVAELQLDWDWILNELKPALILMDIDSYRYSKTKKKGEALLRKIRDHPDYDMIDFNADAEGSFQRKRS